MFAGMCALIDQSGHACNEVALTLALAIGWCLYMWAVILALRVVVGVARWLCRR
jgi:hypothetical protein